MKVDNGLVAISFVALLLFLHKRTMEAIMARKDEISAILQSIQVAVDEMQASVTAILDQLKAGGLTDAEVADLVNQAQTIIDDVASTTHEQTDPVVPAEPTDVFPPAPEE